MKNLKFEIVFDKETDEDESFSNVRILLDNVEIGYVFLIGRTIDNIYLFRQWRGLGICQEVLMKMLREIEGLDGELYIFQPSKELQKSLFILNGRMAMRNIVKIKSKYVNGDDEEWELHLLK